MAIVQQGLVYTNEKCIGCGACFDACEHDAREFYDDTEAFWEDKKTGSKSHDQCQLWGGHYYLGLYKLYYEKSISGWNITALSGSGKLYREVYT